MTPREAVPETAQAHSQAKKNQRNDSILNKRSIANQLRHPSPQPVKLLNSLSMSFTSNPPRLPHRLILTNTFQITSKARRNPVDGSSAVADRFEPGHARSHAGLDLFLASLEVREEFLVEDVECFDVAGEGLGVGVP